MMAVRDAMRCSGVMRGLTPLHSHPCSLPRRRTSLRRTPCRCKCHGVVRRTAARAPPTRIIERRRVRGWRRWRCGQLFFARPRGDGWAAGRRGARSARCKSMRAPRITPAWHAVEFRTTAPRHTALDSASLGAAHCSPAPRAAAGRTSRTQARATGASSTPARGADRSGSLARYDGGPARDAAACRPCGGSLRAACMRGGACARCGVRAGGDAARI